MEATEESLTLQARVKNEEVRRNYVLGINGLKGIAIIGVTLFHMFPQTIQGVFLGVSLFFVISGYLLALSTARQWKENRYSVLSYFKSRIKRIYPSLMIMLLVTIGVYAYILPKTMQGIRPEFLSIVLGYNNWWQILQNSDYFARIANASPFTPLWFLSIELQYFVIWPILFAWYRFLEIKICRYVGWAFIILLCIASAFVMPIRYKFGVDITTLYYGTDTRVYALLFGAALGLFKEKQVNKIAHYNWVKYIWYFIYIILLAAIIGGYLFLNGQNPLVYEYLLLAFTCIFVAMIAICENSNLSIGKLTDTPLLTWLGKRSYGIFLWQYPVLFLAHKLELNSFFVNTFIYYLVLVILILLLTVWTDALSNVITNRESRRAFITDCKKFSIVIISVIGIGSGILGAQAVVMSSDVKINDLSEVQAKIEANASNQELANKKALEAHREVSQDELSGVVGIGDSVMLGAEPSLRNVLPNIYIDAKVSRYVGAGIDIAKQLDEKGQLGDIVLIGLGTNGPITDYYEPETKALLEYLGPNRKIFWVNVYGPDLEWQDSNNKYLEDMANKHSNVTIIDWYGAVSKHQEWLSDDGVHPNDLGVEEYAKLVRKSIENTLSKTEKHK